jgi:HK97 family phage prohead protease
MEHKALAFTLTELKAASSGWEVAGYASTFGGQPDSYGDIVAKGAFADSLLTRPNVRLLWQHDMAEPIGKVISLKEDEKGLLGHWSLVPTDIGTKAHQLLTAGLVDSLSIGFLTKDAEYNNDGTRVLKAVDLFEVSLVTVPANTNAIVTSFKSDVPFTVLLKQASEVLQLVLREAEALHTRRAAEHRTLNDTHLATFADLVAEAEALHQRMRAPVVPPQAAAEAAELALRLELARRKLALGGYAA